jgi:carboxymethylenebutenolidase
MKTHQEGYIDQSIINLYHHFTHGGMNRREFLDRLAELAGSAAAAAAIVPADDPRLVAA